jgi:hypothetical protein
VIRGHCRDTSLTLNPILTAAWGFGGIKGILGRQDCGLGRLNPKPLILDPRAWTLDLRPMYMKDCGIQASKPSGGVL